MLELVSIEQVVGKKGLGMYVLVVEVEVMEAQEHVCVVSRYTGIDTAGGRMLLALALCGIGQGLHVTGAG